MDQIKCECCGKYHDAENMDISFKKPVSYFQVAEEDRDSRINHESDDFLVIDNEIFVVRGVLPIPVHDHDEFCWGIWAQVDEQTFADIWHMFEHDGSGLIFDGKLDGAPPGYKDTYEQPIKIHLGTSDQRPRFMLSNDCCKMSQEQINGVSLHDISEIKEAILGR
jgi:hypothetical protein